MDIHNIKLKLKVLSMRIYFTVKERKYGHRLKYLFFNNHSDYLAIIFSGMGGEKPLYNYVKTLDGIKCNKLYILDDFGYRGGYYWYENGENKPELLAHGLINQIVNKGGGYKRVSTLGTSKGGTCAIYYGLEFGARDIYAGACQYYVGSYLNEGSLVKVFKAAMGEKAGAAEQEILDKKLPDQIVKYAGSKSVVHLFYSPDEHTYKDSIIPLMADLKANNIEYTATIEHFKEHGEVGTFFKPYIVAELKKN